MIKHPLSDIKNLDQMNEYFHRHEFPNPFEGGRFDIAKRQIAQYGKTHAVIGLLQMTMFETSWYLVPPVGVAQIDNAFSRFRKIPT